MTWVFTPGFHGKGRVDWSAMTTEEAAEVLAMLEAVGDSLSAEWGEPWGHFQGGDFRLSNGIAVNVFNDAGDWDYIDSIEMPDGRRWEYPCDTDRPLPMPIANWVPRRDKAKAWGIPVAVCR